MPILRHFILAHQIARHRAGQYIELEAPEGCEVIVREQRRDSAINAALHARLTEIAKRHKWAGQKHDLETWKRLFTAAWLRATGRPVTMLPALDGNGVDIVFRRTSTMTQREVSELLSFIESWEAEQEIEA